MCTRTNGTIYDCPTLNMSKKSDTIFIALHNPSSLFLSSAMISVPSEEWDLYSIDDSEYVDSDIICFNTSILLDGLEQVVKECQMFAQTSVMPKEVKLYKLDFNKDGGQNIIHPEPL